MSEESKYSINSGFIGQFVMIDYMIFIITVLISAGIGAFYAILDRKRVNNTDYHLGGKNMSVFPVAMSLMVTFMSALTLLGNPAEIYNYNTMFMWIIVALSFAIFGATHIFIPFFFKLQVTSTIEYLEMRFSKPVRILSSGIFILQTLIYMASLLYAPALALNAVTGFDLWGCVVGMGIVVTFYTTLGGMKAVLWTDTFQAIVIFAGLFSVLIQGSIVAGGFHEAWQVSERRSRIVFNEFDFDPRKRHSVWSVTIGGTFLWIYLYGINQTQVQRCLACPTIRNARRAMIINYFGLASIVTISCLIGIVMFSFYAECDPITYGLISKSDQLMPLYVMDIFMHIPGLPGLFVSCVVSGSLSSLSSGLNALSAVTFNDWILSLGFNKNCSEFRSTMISKIIVVFYGSLAIGLAWVVSMLGSVLQAIYVVFGILNGPMLGVMTLGMFFPWANKWGALSGILVSLGFTLWIGLGALFHGIRTPLTDTVTTGCNWTAKVSPSLPSSVLPGNNEADGEGLNDQTLHNLYRLSYMWYALIGMIVVWVVGMTTSFLTGFTKPSTVEPRLIIPIFDKLFPFLPETILFKLRFGVAHQNEPAESGNTGTMQDATNLRLYRTTTNACRLAALPPKNTQNTKQKIGRDNLSYLATGVENNNYLSTYL